MAGSEFREKLAAFPDVAIAVETKYGTVIERLLDGLRLDGVHWKQLAPQDPLIKELRLLRRDEVALIRGTHRTVAQRCMNINRRLWRRLTTGRCSQPGPSGRRFQRPVPWSKAANANARSF